MPILQTNMEMNKQRGPCHGGGLPMRHHRLPWKSMLLRTFLKILLLSGLIITSARSLASDSALDKFAQELARGTNLIFKESGPHFGFCFPYANSLILFVMRNQYKLAVLIQFSTLLLCLGSLRPMGFFCRRALKMLLVISTFLKFYRIEETSGEFIALTSADFQRLLHVLLIVATLDLNMYDKGMNVRRFRRDATQAAWKESAKYSTLESLPSDEVDEASTSEMTNEASSIDTSSAKEQ